MKVAIISPTKFLRGLSARTDCQLCYAHMLFQDNRYLEYYAERSAKGNTIIMDTSFGLPRKGISEAEILDATRLLKPTYTILPDVDFSMEKTITRTIDWARISNTLTIGNLQGHDMEALRKCYKALTEEVDIIGLPASNEKIDSRMVIIEELGIKEQCFFIGTYRDPINEIPNLPNVMGISSDHPVRLGIDLRALSEHYPDPPPLDFSLEKMLLPELVEDNVEKFLDLCSEVG